jgi:hypothetical protein
MRDEADAWSFRLRLVEDRSTVQRYCQDARASTARLH